MFDFIWIQMFSVMILMLQLTAAVTEHYGVVVRVGDEVTLSCGNVTDDQDKCNATTWLFTSSSNTIAITLFEHGDIHKNAKTKSHKLSVTANCSLVIRNVSAEDVGQYNCRKFSKSEKKQDRDIPVFLSLVNMTAHKDKNTVTLSCSVLKYSKCQYTVKWLYKDEDIDNNAKDFETSQSTCSASVTFTTSHNVYTSENYEVFKCQVREGKAMQQFSFRNHPLSDQTGWWKFILVGLGVAALFIIVVTFIRWKRTKENNPQMSKNTVEPETAVSYATISFTKKTASKAQVSCLFV
ncbi:uncharacterized protein LOC120433178 isoform X1 [Oreochromis aureus]|uniref:uncharacterized protein LOC120433178 isoform X1 n=1 Tax=Oreochromis aureus TaxID=47969 RepID=UPI001952E3BB|nr:uncharacterized protein LOC120433178 isoform X1 [Oreochromis aureus]